MAETAAMIGYGSTVEISTNGGDTWTEIEEVFNLVPPPFTIDTVDATHMQSPNRTREFIPGINDPGDTTFAINWIPGSTADTAIRALAVGFTRFSVRETFPNGAYWVMSGILTGYAPTAPNDDKMSAEVTIKVTSTVTHNAAAAPENELPPAISGVPEEGEVLFAWPGQWTGGGAFTYVWENDGVAIEGAASQTYTVVAADEGDPITVVVTSTNSVGAASATSAPVVIDSGT